MNDTRLTDEMIRILHAIADGRMTTNGSGRYVIDGESRPDRKSREKLRGRGLIVHWWDIKNGYEWRITAKGKQALRDVSSSPCVSVDAGGNT